MNILVINSGSSSLKFSIYNGTTPEPLPILDGQVSGIGTATNLLQLRLAGGATTPDKAVVAATPVEALHCIFDSLQTPGIPKIDAIGYRVVHSGPALTQHQLITAAVLHDLEAARPFAPLHEPDAVRLIRAAMDRYPAILHFACFDTVFHQTMPEAATTYAIPLAYRTQGVRRYGFHGLSCESVVRRLRLTPGLEFPARLIIAHLGSGCSVTAVVDGRSVDTTMGLTPTGGLVMGTRPGDLDPGLIFFLLRQSNATVDSVEAMLNHDAGIRALFGENDMRALREAANSGDSRAALAATVFASSIRRAIGGMVALYGCDAIAFTGGIGEHDAITRFTAANHLFGGAPEIDVSTNLAATSGFAIISTIGSAFPVYVVPAEEDLIIAKHVARLAASN